MELTNSSMRESQERFRQLLMSIEDLYMVILAIDELGKAVLALPEEKRGHLYQERDTMIEVLYSRILYSPPGTNERPSFALLTLSSVRKGKKLIGRSIPLFSVKQQQAVLLAIIEELPLLLKRDYSDKIFPSEVFPSLKETIEESPLKALIAFAKTLLKHSTSHSTIVCSEFGLSLILCFLSSAETIYSDAANHSASPTAAPTGKEPSPATIDPEAQETWQSTVVALGNALEWLGEKKITPFKSQSWNSSIPKIAANKHLARFVETSVLQKIELQIDGVVPNEGPLPMEVVL
jgi:hypothetical protein